MSRPACVPGPDLRRLVGVGQEVDEVPAEGGEEVGHGRDVDEGGVEGDADGQSRPVHRPRLRPPVRRADGRLRHPGSSSRLRPSSRVTTGRGLRTRPPWPWGRPPTSTRDGRTIPIRPGRRRPGPADRNAHRRPNRGRPTMPGPTRWPNRLVSSNTSTSPTAPSSRTVSSRARSTLAR